MRWNLLGSSVSERRDRAPDSPGMSVRGRAQIGTSGAAESAGTVRGKQDRQGLILITLSMRYAGSSFWSMSRRPSAELLRGVRQPPARSTIQAAVGTPVSRMTLRRHYASGQIRTRNRVRPRDIA